MALIGSLLTAMPLSPAGLGFVEAGVIGVLTVAYGVPPARGDRDRHPRLGDQRPVDHRVRRDRVRGLADAPRGGPDPAARVGDVRPDRRLKPAAAVHPSRRLKGAFRGDRVPLPGVDDPNVRMGRTFVGERSSSAQTGLGWTPPNRSRADSDARSAAGTNG